jgi:hypothetical protein
MGNMDEITELREASVELQSLRQTIKESVLAKYFPKKEMSFHDKVALAIGEMEAELTANKQVAFSLKSDIENKSWIDRDNDFKFLKEMKSHAKKWLDKKDITSQEMLFQMIDDWMAELKKKTA